MTKLFSIIAVAIVATSFVACGPSAEDKAKAEAKLQHDADSISKIMTDGLENAVQTAVETASAAETASVAETVSVATEAAGKK